jgi:small multidrug resistance pump
MGYVYLAGAIIFEVIGTNFMKASAGFSKLLPTTVTVVTYLLCYYCFAQSLKTVNLSVAYATWGAVGIILTTIIAVLIWRERVTLPEILGIVLIIIGTFLCNFFANS